MNEVLASEPGEPVQPSHAVQPTIAPSPSARQEHAAGAGRSAPASDIWGSLPSRVSLHHRLGAATLYRTHAPIASL